MQQFVLTFNYQPFPVTFNSIDGPVSLKTTTCSSCLTELKIEGQTGKKINAGSSSPHKIQLSLRDGTLLQGTVCPSTKNAPYLCTLSFATGFNAGSKCVDIMDIDQVSLIAGGNDGWYIASISTYAKTSTSRYIPLTKNDNLYKWLDGNNLYPYDAKKIVLTIVTLHHGIH